MPKESVIDTRNGDYMVADGTKLRLALLNRIAAYRDQYKALMSRMENELPSKEEAIPLMIAMHLQGHTVNERVLMFRSFVERGAWLDAEIRELTLRLSTFRDGASYQLTLADLARYGA